MFDTKRLRLIGRNVEWNAPSGIVRLFGEAADELDRLYAEKREFPGLRTYLKATPATQAVIRECIDLLDQSYDDRDMILITLADALFPSQPVTLAAKEESP